MKSLVLLVCLVAVVLSVGAVRTSEDKSEMPPLFVSEQEAENVLPEEKILERCHAHAFEMGPLCNSSKMLKGATPHTKVDYFIDLKDDKTTGVFCYGLGMGYCLAPLQCSWGYHFLGLISTGTASLIWGENDDYPSIKCTAIPKAAHLRWRWEKGFCTHACGDDDEKK